MPRVRNWLGLLCVLWAGAASAQDVYRWVDAQGQEHFTDDPSLVPKGVQPTVLGSVAPPPAPRPTAKPVTLQHAPEPARPAVPAATAPERNPTVRLVRVVAGVSEADRDFIEAELRRGAASEQLVHWGGLVRSVDAEVAGAGELDRGPESAFGRAVSPTRILLRSPNDVRGDGRPLPYAKAVLHELAHTLEMQRAGAIAERWFAEGFANVVAEFDGYASPEDVAWWVLARGGPTPLAQVFRRPDNIHVAYSVATSAVRFIVAQFGRDQVLAFFARRQTGRPFDDAFREVFGQSVRELEGRWVESLRPAYHERAAP